MKTMTMRKFSRILVLILLLGPVLSTSSRADSYEQTACPDTLLYLIKPGDSLLKIAKRHRVTARYFSVPELISDIRRANRLESDLLLVGDPLLIPVMPLREPSKVFRKVCDGAQMRGIYLTAAVCSHSSVQGKIDRFIAAGGNAVVLDIKDIDGGVSCHTPVQLADYGFNRRAPLISDLPAFVAGLRDRGIYVVARLALFLDGNLGARHPDWALKDEHGQPWTERGQVWMNPASTEVRRYNIELARAAADAGVDEIQFDYVRYPTNGWRNEFNDVLPVPRDFRQRVIVDFLQQARLGLADHDVLLSVDLFGIVGWNREADRAVTGQDVAAIAGQVDIICPMVYPSHFCRGYGGYDRPADHPEFFVAEATRRFSELAGPEVAIRPWLQAFSWGVKNYDGSYVLRQVRGAHSAGSSGWCLWNPSCNYESSLAVLPASLPEVRVDMRVAGAGLDMIGPLAAP